MTTSRHSTHQLSADRSPDSIRSLSTSPDNNTRPQESATSSSSTTSRHSHHHSHHGGLTSNSLGVGGASASGSGGGVAGVHGHVLRKDVLSLPQPTAKQTSKPVVKQHYTFDVNEKLLIVMVGLPARGKTYTAKKLIGYLNWLGFRVKIFNFDEKKRSMPPNSLSRFSASSTTTTSPKRNHSPTSSETESNLSEALTATTSSPSFRSPSSTTSVASPPSPELSPKQPPPLLVVINPSEERGSPQIQVVSPEEELTLHMMKLLLKDTFDWFDNEDGEIAIFVPCATTYKQQVRLVSRCEAHARPGKSKIDVLFVENICNDTAILTENMKNKIASMEAKGRSFKDAALQLQAYITQYQSKFDTIEEDTLSYVKIIDLRSKIICNRIYGHLPSVITNFLMSIHVGVRPIWLMTPAQVCVALPVPPSPLSSSSDVVTFDPEGEKFRKSLPMFVDRRIPVQKDTLVVFTSAYPQAIKTVEYLQAARKVETPVLNPLNTGLCSGLSKAEAAHRFPEVWRRYKENPFWYRFPNGESYADVVRRLETFVLQLERFTVPVLVVVHETVLQLLFCYFKNLDVTQAPMLNVPKHTVVELASTRAGWTDRAFQLVKEESTTETNEVKRI